jgi:hypothetical protein
MRVKIGSIRSMDSDTNPVTSVQRGVIRARNSVSMRVSVIHGSEDSTLSPMASYQTATGSRWRVEQGEAFLHDLWQDAEQVRQLVLFIWSVRSVWFVWLHETNQMDQTDQITRETGLAPDVQAIKVLLCRNGFSAAC